MCVFVYPACKYNSNIVASLFIACTRVPVCKFFDWLLLRLIYNEIGWTENNSASSTQLKLTNFHSNLDRFGVQRLKKIWNQFYFHKGLCVRVYKYIVQYFYVRFEQIYDRSMSHFAQK